MSDDKYNALEPHVTASEMSGISVTFGPATIGPGRWPLYIAEGADWTQYVSWFTAPNFPQSLGTGFTAAFVVYDRPGGSVLLTLTDGAGMTLADTVPTITISRTATQTAALPWSQQAWFVLRVTRTNDSAVFPILHGVIEIRR